MPLESATVPAVDLPAGGEERICSKVPPPHHRNRYRAGSKKWPLFDRRKTIPDRRPGNPKCRNRSPPAVRTGFHWENCSCIIRSVEMLWLRDFRKTYVCQDLPCDWTQGTSWWTTLNQRAPKTDLLRCARSASQPNKQNTVEQRQLRCE